MYTNKKTTMVQDITGWQYTWDTVISTDAAEIASHKDYITFDKGNIILGDSASASKLKLTKDSIQFKGTSDTAIKPDSDATAWITGKVFHINSGEIESSLKFGKVLMKPTKNGIQIGNKAEFGERVRIGYPLSSNMQYTYSDCPLVVGSNTGAVDYYPWFAVDDGYAFIRNGIITPGDFIIKFGEYTLDRPDGSKFSGTLRPYYRADDVINMEFYVNGYVTSNKQEVIFLIPFSRPIMSTKVSISSINGLTIRQNGKYIYNSTASKPIKPASYTAAVIGGRNGLNVRAKMGIDSNGFTDTDIKNIVNNDTCAIMASIQYRKLGHQTINVKIWSLLKIIQEDGVITEYHRILYVSNTVNSHCSVAVISLASEEIRNKQLAGEIQQPYQKIVTYETEKFSDLSIKEAYEYLKTLLEFEGAEDVFEDKDNSV